MLTSIENVQIETDSERLADSAAQRCLQLANAAIEQRGYFTIALSGGNTPRLLYHRLASPALREHTDWTRWRVFFSDERCVPPGHEQSNYRMARQTLLEHVPIEASHIHPMAPTSDEPALLAARYTEHLQGQVEQDSEHMPVFDLILLGLGDDGHTASLFPNSSALSVLERPVTEVHIEKLQSWRLSLTYPVLNRARHLLFLVAGASKSAVLRELNQNPNKSPPYPVQQLSPRGELQWFLDRAAAEALKP